MASASPALSGRRWLVSAWVVTVPVGMLLGWLLYSGLHLVTGVR